MWASGGLLEALSAVTEIVTRDSIAWFINGNSKLKKNVQATLNSFLAKPDFFCLSHLFLPKFGNNLLLSKLGNCVCNESCREKMAPISSKGPKFLALTDFVYIL